MELYSLITDKLAKDLPSPDSKCVNEAHQDFYYTILQTAKRFIPCGRRNNFRLCWDVEYESLDQNFLKALSGEVSNKVTSYMLAQIDEKRRGYWSELSIPLTSHSPVGWHGIPLAT